MNNFEVGIQAKTRQCSGAQEIVSQLKLVTQDCQMLILRFSWRWKIGNVVSQSLLLSIKKLSLTFKRSMVVDHIRQAVLDEASTRSNVAVAYFYCDNKDPRTHSVTELLSVVIKELIRKNGTVPEELDKLHQRYTDTEKAPSKADLLNLIRSLSMPFEKVFVLIDALV